MEKEGKEVATQQQAGVMQKLDAGSLIMAAIEKNVPIEALERLLAMREVLRKEDARDQFYRALSQFQARCPVIPKDKTAGAGTGFQYKYAPLETIIRCIAPILEQTGLSFSFDTQDTETEKTVICKVHHISGHSESSSFKVPIDTKARMNDTQKQGSAGTYAKRYALCNALGILTGDEDDDGAGSAPGAAGHAPAKKAPEPPQKAAPAGTPTGEKTQQPAPPPREKPAEKPASLVATGLITDIVANPKKTATGGTKTKIVIGGQPFYTFDQKIVDYADKISMNGPVEVSYHANPKGYGNDIDGIMPVVAEPAGKPVEEGEIPW